MDVNECADRVVAVGKRCLTQQHFLGFDQTQDTCRALALSNNECQDMYWVQQSDSLNGRTGRCYCSTFQGTELTCDVQDNAQYTIWAKSANPCHNDGACTNHNGGFSCACNAGWEGAHCEVDIDECAVTTTSQHYELVTQTKCQAANGQDWQQFYKTSGFNQATCQDWCDETNRRTPGDCVAYGMGIRSDLVTACMIYLRNGAADPRSLTGVEETVGPVAATAATAADGTQHVVSKTWDRNWECRKNVVTTTANACHNHGACTNHNGGFGCACTGSWSGDTCSTYTALQSRWWSLPSLPSTSWSRFRFRI